MVGVTGAYGSLQYKEESAFKTVNAADAAKVFGRGQKISSINIKNNLELIYELGARTAQKGVFKQFEGTMTIEWVLANPWFFRFLLGTAVHGGAGPTYTHTYTKALTLPTMQISAGIDLSTDVVRNFDGVVMNSLTMTSAVNELIKCRGEFMFAKEEATSTTFVAATVDTYDPFSFEHATLELPSGSVLAEVQSFEFTINNNVQMIWGLGNKEAVAFVAQALELTGRLNITFQSAALLDYVKNRAEITDLKLTITNSGAGALLRSFVITGTGVLFDEHSSAMEPNVLIMQDVPLRIRDITSIVATDATTTEP